jgi:hypothetical protein
MHSWTSLHGLSHSFKCAGTVSNALTSINLHWWSAVSFSIGEVCARSCECPHRKKSKDWSWANMGAVARKLIDCEHPYWYERSPRLDAAKSQLQFVQEFYVHSICTYLLTPWSRVLLQKLTCFAASLEIPRIYGTLKFITVLASARHLSLSWARSIQSPQPPPIVYVYIYY